MPGNYSDRLHLSGSTVVKDLSTNGLILNGHKIRKASAIVMHGDTFKIPASQCMYQLCTILALLDEH